jgi:hypothetical protein
MTKKQVTGIIAIHINNSEYVCISVRNLASVFQGMKIPANTVSGISTTIGRRPFQRPARFLESGLTVFPDFLRRVNMNRRVPLWLARVAVAMCGTAPFVALAQEVPQAIVILDEGPSPPPVVAPADSGPLPAGGGSIVLGQAAEQTVPDHWMGVHLDVISDVVKAQLDIPHGMAVIEAIDKGPAQKAGIQKHDILTTANGAAINSQDDIFRILSQSKGEAIIVQVVRKGNRFAIRLTPEKRPESAKPARVTVDVPAVTPPRVVVVPVAPQPTPPVAVPVAPKPVQPPALPPADLSQAHEWIKELELAIAEERKAAADHLQDAQKAYEGAINSIDVREIESVINSAIDELSKAFKDHVREGLKALQSDDAKTFHREVLEGMGNLERALRDQREVQKRERLELRVKPEGSIESLRQEIKSLRDEIERIKREPLGGPELRAR